MSLNNDAMKTYEAHLWKSLTDNLYQENKFSIILFHEVEEIFITIFQIYRSFS